MEKKTIIENINNYKVIHNIPILSDEEREEKKKEILLKMINQLSNDKAKLI